jgi:Gly-Xaa carboxypeptidase
MGPWSNGLQEQSNWCFGSFETLLEKDFTPERTILAVFGFDEEISGPQGARFISKYLEDTKGKDSIDLIIDEGGLGIKEINGTTFALPGLGEKGRYGLYSIRTTVLILPQVTSTSV